MNQPRNKLSELKTAFALFFVTSLICVAQSDRNYAAAQAAQHVGETATVTDKVDGVHQSGKGNIFLNMGGKYPNQSFTGFIPSSSASSVPNPQQYGGKTISISGKIVLYRGKPEIVVNSSSQLRIEP
jgi:hypothetical protein